jgi:hypothetical protein
MRQCGSASWQHHCATVAVVEPEFELAVSKHWQLHWLQCLHRVSRVAMLAACNARALIKTYRPPGGFLDSSNTSPGGASASATVTAPVPTNAMDGSNRDCGTWYTVSESFDWKQKTSYTDAHDSDTMQIQAGDTCALVSIANSIALADFYFLNPEINKDCTNLLLGIAYCVKAVGNIHTYSGYTITNTALPVTVPPASFPSVNTAIPTPSSDPGFTYTVSLLPTAPGTIPGCDVYQNSANASSPWNDCSNAAYANQVSPSELMTWNPSLSRNLSMCELKPGFSYCVRLHNATSQLF